MQRLMCLEYQLRASDIAFALPVHGYSQHSDVVIVCDGSDDAHARLGRVLRNDPGTGDMRHADAGYDIAKQCARESGLDLPMLAK